MLITFPDCPSLSSGLSSCRNAVITRKQSFCCRNCICTPTGLACCCTTAGYITVIPVVVVARGWKLWHIRKICVAPPMAFMQKVVEFLWNLAAYAVQMNWCTGLLLTNLDSVSDGPTAVFSKRSCLHVATELRVVVNAYFAASHGLRGRKPTAL